MDARYLWTLLLTKPLLLGAVHAAWVLRLAASGIAEPWWVGAAAWPTTQAIGYGVVGTLLLLGVRSSGVWLPRPDAAAARVAALAVVPAVLLAACSIVVAGWLFPEPRHAAFLLAGAGVSVTSLVIAPALAAVVEVPLAVLALQRLGAVGWRRGVAVVIALLAFAAGSIAAPFVPAMAFTIWRGVAFLPLSAATLALVLARPRTLAFVVGGHALGGAWFAWAIARG